MKTVFEKNRLALLWLRIKWVCEVDSFVAISIVKLTKSCSGVTEELSTSSGSERLESLKSMWVKCLLRESNMEIINMVNVYAGYFWLFETAAWFNRTEKDSCGWAQFNSLSWLFWRIWRKETANLCSLAHSNGMLAIFYEKNEKKAKWFYSSWVQ